MKSKLYAFTLALALTITMVGSAFAEVKSFGKFTLDVPASWTSSVDAASGTVLLVANDKSGSISITIGKTDGATIDQLAQAFAQQLKGSKPEKDADGDYSFNFQSGAVQSQAFVTGEGKEYSLVVVTGENAEMGTILSSMQEK